MSEALRVAASGGAALAGRVADALAAVVDAVLDALRGGIVGPAPVLRPVPVRARGGRAARGR